MKTATANIPEFLFKFSRLLFAATKQTFIKKFDLIAAGLISIVGDSTEN